MNHFNCIILSDKLLSKVFKNEKFSSTILSPRTAGLPLNQRFCPFVEFPSSLLRRWCNSSTYDTDYSFLYVHVIIKLCRENQKELALDVVVAFIGE